MQVQRHHFPISVIAARIRLRYISRENKRFKINRLWHCNGTYVSAVDRDAFRFEDTSGVVGRNGIGSRAFHAASLEGVFNKLLLY